MSFAVSISRCGTNAPILISPCGFPPRTGSASCVAPATLPYARRSRQEQGLALTGHQVEVFLIEPGTNRYLGRLRSFNECPKGKRDCLVPGCGTIPFNKRIAEFTPRDDLLASAEHMMLYRRGVGRLRSAPDLPGNGVDDP